MNKTFKISKRNDLKSNNHPIVGSVAENVYGHWYNVNPDTGLIKEVNIYERGGACFFHAIAAGENGPIDWGETGCRPYYATVESNAIEGFHAEYKSDDLEVLMCVNVKYGVFVLQTYTRFKDGSERQDYFGREFFSRAKTSDIELTGFWKNTRVETNGLTGFNIVEKEGDKFIHLKGIKDGVFPEDWGLAKLIFFMKGMDSDKVVGWWADYDLPELNAQLSININRGLIIIAAMVEFKDGKGKSNIFIREFFAKNIP